MTAPIKVRKNGNSLGLTIPKDIAAQARLKVDDQLYPVVEADGTIVLRPFDPEFVEQVEALLDVMREDAAVFAALAK